MNNQPLQDAIELLQMLTEEEDAGKAFRERVNSIITLLTSKAPLAVEKSLLELEELNSLEISSYFRTQVWDVVSLLESAKR